jgi:hypothetical protein
VKTGIMRTLKLFLSFLFLMAFLSCKKGTLNPQIIPIPNGDFENWNNVVLLNWQTNSCASCTPPWETYIVQKVTDANSGQFAAKFIYNEVYQSWAYDKFSISIHPSLLTGYVKADIAAGDTAVIHIDLFSGSNIVDSGNWYQTSSNANYKKVEIQISQTSSAVDSASIKIVGGRKQGTEFNIDDLVFIKTY